MDIVILVAVIGFTGQIVAVVVAAWLSARSSRKAGVMQVDALHAQRDAADAARELVLAAQNQSVLIQENRRAIDAVAETNSATHRIVNSQRTVMLRLVAQLARRIADENPDDHKAQQAADAAERDAAKAERNH